MSTDSTIEDLSKRAHAAMGANDLPTLRSVVQELTLMRGPEVDALHSMATGTIAALTGDLPAAFELFAIARERYRMLGDVPSSVHATVNMGMAQVHLADLPRAYELLHEALGMATSLEDRQLVARIYNGIGSVHRLTGDYPKAAEVYHRALEIFQELELWFSVGMIAGNLGGVYRPMREHERALESYQRALALFEEVGASFQIVQTLGALGQTLADLENFADSEVYYQRAVDMAQSAGFAGEEARWTIYLASHACGLDRPDEARSLLSRVDAASLNDPHVIVSHAILNGELHQRDGDRNAAALAYERGLSVATSIGSPHLASDVHDSLRALARLNGDLEKYIHHSEEYHRLQEELYGKDAAVKLAMIEKQREIDVMEQRHQRHLDILYSTLPQTVADRVARGETVNDTHSNAAVLFLDIAGFTSRSSTMDPRSTTDLLAEIFEHFDDLCESRGVIKIKTIGDAYMAAALEEDSAVSLALVALDMINGTFRWSDGSQVRFRIGLHAGPVVAGVIGTKRLQYDVWGDTVNVASRMESTGEPGRVHVSSSFAEAIRGERDFNLVPRGEVDIKGKGRMATYWLEGA